MNNTENDILISFVIPAHNSEKTLDNCVTSIETDINSTCIPCEVIIIENASEDKTLDIVGMLQDKYSNIVLKKSGKGVSKARNCGLDVARGQKVIFVDSDDIWMEGSIDTIAKQLASATADLLMYGYYKENKKIIHNYDRMEQIFSENIDEFKAWLLSQPTMRMQVWAKVFDNSLIKDTALHFNEELLYSEDSEFLLRYVMACKTVGVFSKPIYRYSCNGISAVRVYNPHRMQEYIKSLEVVTDDVKNESDFVKKAYLEYVLAHFNLIAVHDIFDLQIEDTFINKLQKMKTLKNKPLFREALDKIPLRKCLNIHLSPEACIKCRLDLMGGLICYIKAFLNYRKQKKIL